MGPSGSGKSTLLDVLAGRIKKETNMKKSLTGEILVNGSPIDDNFKRVAAYGNTSQTAKLILLLVMQDDTLQGSLSVRDNLRFSANLRLPKSYSAQQREDTVSEIIEVLGLTRSADTPIGDVFRRGVSGTAIFMFLNNMPKGVKDVEWGLEWNCLAYQVQNILNFCLEFRNFISR
jgi:ATP-binding cassette subfamily G (WHITE) protein 2